MDVCGEEQTRSFSTNSCEEKRRRRSRIFDYPKKRDNKLEREINTQVAEVLHILSQRRRRRSTPLVVRIVYVIILGTSLIHMSKCDEQVMSCLRDVVYFFAVKVPSLATSQGISVGVYRLCRCPNQQR